MPGLTGLELLREAKAVAPDVDVILLTAFGTVEEAVRAMKDGATDFLTKPFQRAQLTKVVRQALERRDLIAQNRALQKRLDDLLRQGNMIGTSPAFRRLMTLVQQVADSSATVLVQGGSGTGKELVARAIHDRPSRRDGPFIAVNCAALPQTLLEAGPGLAQQFRGGAGAKNNRQLDGFSDEALGCLEAYSWPGNVRELENVVERAVVLARGLRVDAADLPDAVRERSVMLLRGGPAGPADATTAPDAVFQVRIGTPLPEVEARLPEAARRLNSGNQTPHGK